MVPQGRRKFAGDPLQLGERAIAAVQLHLRYELGKPFVEIECVCHARLSSPWLDHNSLSISVPIGGLTTCGAQRVAAQSGKSEKYSTKLVGGPPLQRPEPSMMRSPIERSFEFEIVLASPDYIFECPVTHKKECTMPAENATRCKAPEFRRTFSKGSAKAVVISSALAGLLLATGLAPSWAQGSGSSSQSAAAQLSPVDYNFVARPISELPFRSIPAALPRKEPRRPKFATMRI